MICSFWFLEKIVLHKTALYEASKIILQSVKLEKIGLHFKRPNISRPSCISASPMSFTSNHCEKRDLQAGLHKFREMNSKAYHLLYDMFGLYFLVKNNIFLRGLVSFLGNCEICMQENNFPSIKIPIHTRPSPLR